MKNCCKEWLNFAVMVKDERFRRCPYCGEFLRERKLVERRGSYKVPKWTAEETLALVKYWKTETIQELAKRLPLRTEESINGKIKRMRNNGYIEGHRDPETVSRACSQRRYGDGEEDK